MLGRTKVEVIPDAGRRSDRGIAPGSPHFLRSLDLSGKPVRVIVARGGLSTIPWRVVFAKVARGWATVHRRQRPGAAGDRAELWPRAADGYTLIKRRQHDHVGQSLLVLEGRLRALRDSSRSSMLVRSAKGGRAPRWAARRPRVRRIRQGATAADRLRERRQRSSHHS